MDRDSCRDLAPLLGHGPILSVQMVLETGKPIAEVAGDLGDQ